MDRMYVMLLTANLTYSITLFWIGGHITSERLLQYITTRSLIVDSGQVNGCIHWVCSDLLAGSEWYWSVLKNLVTSMISSHYPQQVSVILTSVWIIPHPMATREWVSLLHLPGCLNICCSMTREWVTWLIAYFLVISVIFMIQNVCDSCLSVRQSLDTFPFTNREWVIQHWQVLIIYTSSYDE